MITNKSFDELVKYLDNDLADHLTDEHRDRVVSLACAAAVIGTRVRTREENREAMLSAVRRETPITDPTTELWIDRVAMRIPMPVMVGVPLGCIAALVILNW